eukprot:gene6682-344_t
MSLPHTRILRQWDRVWHHARAVPTLELCYLRKDSDYKAICGVNGIDSAVMQSLDLSSCHSSQPSKGEYPSQSICGPSSFPLKRDLNGHNIHLQFQEDSASSQQNLEKEHQLLRALVAVSQDTPLLCKGAIDSWPCVRPNHPRNWQTVDNWMSLSDRIVTVECGSYMNSSFSRKSLNWSEFLHYLVECEREEEISSYEKKEQDNYVNAGSQTRLDKNTRMYLAQQDITALFPELLCDLRAPLQIKEESIYERLLWIGPNHTVSPLHRDPLDNLFCQIRSAKRFVFVKASHRDPRLRVSNHPRRRNTSLLDLTTSLAEIEHASPGFKDLPCYSTIVCPGDVLFIPRNYWHFVEAINTDFSCSVSYMFDLSRAL